MQRLTNKRNIFGGASVFLMLVGWAWTLFILCRPLVAQAPVSPLAGDKDEVNAVTGLRFEGSYGQRKQQLDELDSEQLDELRRRKLKFDQLTDAQRLQISDMHASLSKHEAAEDLRMVMYRYYRWLKTLDEKTQRELLDLPSSERVDAIRRIRDLQARESFGRIGATRLPDEDLGWVYEWTKQTVANSTDEIDALLNSDEVKSRLPKAWVNRVSESARTAALYNFRFVLLVEHAPEHAGEIAFKEFANLRKGLSKSALEIIDAYEQDEQKQLILQWFKAAHYAQNQVTDARLYQFWQSLTADDREQLERLSRNEWRERLEKKYFHASKLKRGQRARKGSPSR